MPQAKSSYSVHGGEGGGATARPHVPLSPPSAVWIDWYICGVSSNESVHYIAIAEEVRRQLTEGIITTQAQAMAVLITEVQAREAA